MAALPTVAGSNNTWGSELNAFLGVSMNGSNGAMLDGVAFGTNPATAGTIRLPNAGWIAGRNAANSANINALRINTSNIVELQGPVTVALGGATAGDSLNITGGNAPGAALTNKALSMAWLQQNNGDPAAGYSPVNLVQQSIRTTGTAAVAYTTFNTTTQHGSSGAAAMGSPLGQGNNVVVQGQGSASNEPCAYFGVLNSQIGTGFTQTAAPTGRYWFTDWSVHGPVAVQPNLLNGITMLVNNHYSGSPSSTPSAGIWIVTKQAAGGAIDATHAAAATFAVDVGLGITGIASTAATAGFTTGIQLGGTGSGWGTASSRFVNAMTIADYTGYGIKITGKFSGSTPSAAISVAAASGPIIVGAATALSANSLLELQTSGTTDPAFLIGNSSGSDSISMWIRNSVSITKIILAGGASAFGVVGTAAGDAGWIPFTGKKIHLAGSTLSVVAVKEDNTLGFFNTTTVAQQAGTGETVGFTAGGGTTVTDASTFTGNSGTKAYRISDVVKALKNYGLLAAS